MRNRNNATLLVGALVAAHLVSLAVIAILAAQIVHHTCTPPTEQSAEHNDCPSLESWIDSGNNTLICSADDQGTNCSAYDVPVGTTLALHGSAEGNWLEAVDNAPMFDVAVGAPGRYDPVTGSVIIP